MTGADTEYLEKHKKFRVDFRKLAAAFVALAFIIAIIVFWWLKLVGITITGEAFCNMSEHTHGENCYVSELICEIADIEEETTEATYESTLPCEEDMTADIHEGNETTEPQTTAESHIHNDECYEKVLICNTPEHIHTGECYPDFNADVETQSDWLRTFEDVKLTDSPAENLVNIAKTQLGYKESTLNFKYDDNGVKNGYTRYGEWYGNPYGNWNAMFISFCLSYSNIENADALISSGAETMHQLWQNAEAFEAADDHSTKVGEIVFFDTDGDGVTDHTAIVSEVSEEKIKVITGDLDGSVEETDIDDSMVIIGYGLTHKLKTVEEVTTTEEATTQETTTEEAITEEPTTQSTSQNKDILSVNDVYSDPEWSEKVSAFEKNLSEKERSKLDELSEKERKAVLELSYTISLLPTVDEFFEALDYYYENDDEYGETRYITLTQDKMISAYAHYQPIGHLEEYIIGLSNLLDLKDVYSATPFTTGTSAAVTFNYINQGWSAVAPVIIYGGNASEKLTSGSNVNQYWNGIVVEYNSTDKYYYVSQKYKGGSESSATTVRSLEATTSKGFVIFIWMADSGATDLQKAAATVADNVVVGDRVSITVDPTSLSSGYSSAGYGSIIFAEKPKEPVVENIPVSDINDGELSDAQVKDAGGITTSPDDDVKISKSIDGTDIENVFDITLTVRTESSIQTYLADPDMAVVIVMDISNTMNSAYGGTTRYAAAVVAAENFINQFAAKGQGISKLGFVAFNTHAHEILPVQKCTTANAASLISEMKSDTEAIISASGYADAWTRFTNIEAGLKMGYDMLANSGNENKYIVFLSDGFPTTYIESGYNGYNPNDESGTRFYDSVELYNGKNRPCSYGTSYSDEAAIRAREMATNIKNMGATIFSIGVNVSGQSIANYVSSFVGKSFSVVDRRSTNYEIGSESATYPNNMTAFENWLMHSIGSDYYYDSNNQTQITNAFNAIFEAIQDLNEESRKTIWTTTDPLPVLGEDSSTVEFINFYDKNGNPVYDVKTDPGDTVAYEYIDGEFGVGEENTAFHKDRTIYWDLKDSGYTETKSEDGNTTYYHYKIKYRIRLYNENPLFVERQTYVTNGDAFLEYKTVVTNDNVTTISDNKVLYFEKPAVEGYYAEFAFYKKSDLGDPLEGAVFTLTHNDELCSVCHGNGEPVTTVSTLTYTSEADGTVNFTKIPSGHIYNLEETTAPEGYIKSPNTYIVSVAMDELSISAAGVDGPELSLQDNEYTFTNYPIVYILPETGGPGTLPLAIIGFALMAFPILYSILRRKRERRFN